jgi:protein-S-isoprenylcysteine O-methyltransferase Ste14
MTGESKFIRAPDFAGATGAVALHDLIAALWIAWLAYWFAAARNVKRARWRETGVSRAFHIVLLLLCGGLLAGRPWLPPALTTRFVPQGRLLPVFGTLAVAAGLAFAVWARRHLGRNWSGIVTVKEDHTLIRSGPYRFVRHPIYSGLLLALLGTAAAIGEVRGVLAVACALAGFLRKIRIEERMMSRIFAEYRQYSEETAALIPFLY